MSSTEKFKVVDMGSPGERSSAPTSPSVIGWLLPGILLVLMMAGVVALWVRLEREEHRRIALETEVTTQQMTLRLDAWINARLAMLSHLATDHSHDSTSDRRDFIEDAQELIQTFPGFQAINWVTADGVIQTTVPEAGNEAALGKNLFVHPEPDVPQSLRRAMDSGEVTRTSAVTLLQGGQGVALYWPVYDESDQLAGFINAVFRLDELISLCFSDERLKRDFTYLIEEVDGENAYLYGAWDSPEGVEYEVAHILRIVNRPWNLRVRPTPALLSRSRVITDELMLGLGAVLALAVAWLMRTIVVRQRVLKESEENYRQLIEGATELIYVVHESGTILLANAPAAALFQQTPEKITGKTLESLLGPELAEQRLALFRQALTAQKPLRVENREEVGSTTRYYFTSLRPLKNRMGIYDRALVIATDVTEQKASERAIREGEARYRLLADHVTDVIWTVDMKLNVTYVSPSVKALVGYSVEELKTRKVSDFIPPQAFNRIMKVVTEEIPRGEHQPEAGNIYRTFEAPILHRDGGQVWTESATTILRNEDGEAVGILGCTRDVTRRKRVEQEKASLEHQLLQSQKMEAVGTLAGGIAHDFNNLLTGVLGYANLLKLESEPGEEVFEAADVIEKAADRAAQLTRQLLGFARKGKLQDTPVDVHKTIQEVITLLARTLNKNIEISQKLAASNSFVKGDPTQVQQIVLNLAVNARDAMPRGGQLTFRTENIEISEASDGRSPDLKPDNYMLLTVSDTGGGIPSEIRDRVFEPFFTTKEQGKGTGMGLATVYGIVKNHGGVVRLVESSEEGTTFEVYLPIAVDMELQEVPDESANGSTMGSGCVIVIDDEAVVRKLAGSMLSRLGYEPKTFAGPEEAITYFREHHEAVSLVIVDMVMPGMNGQECIAEIQAIDPTCPIILSSGYGRDGLVQETIADGLAGFVEKPYRLHALSEVVEQALRSSAGDRS